MEILEEKIRRVAKEKVAIEPYNPMGLGALASWVFPVPSTNLVAPFVTIIGAQALHYHKKFAR